MGQKVHPVSFRLGITEEWRSRWYARKSEFGKFVVADKKVRDYVKKHKTFAGIARIDIERTRDEVRVMLHCARPGVIIGRKGVDVERLRTALEEIVGGKVDIRIIEITRPELNGQLVAQAIAEQLKKRSSFKRTVRRAAETTMDSGAEGVRIRIAGRLGGAEMSRTELLSLGSVPLHTLRAKIDYGFVEALTTYGHIGVKVWVHRGFLEDGETIHTNKEAGHGANAKKG
jgi:small subunit ribosomal protein S3